MSSDKVLISASNVSKRYEIYPAPQDRLKQIIFPRLKHFFNRQIKKWKLPEPETNYFKNEYFREFWALRDISFELRRGETLGIIGCNGSGKSTLLQILAGTLSPTVGSVHIMGRVAALLELGSGFNPEFTGIENIFLNARILGLSQSEITNRLENIIAFADIGEFINQPVKTYSSGMFVRLAFAVQAFIDAEIVIIDEALAVGDIFFTQKCLDRLRKLVDSGAAVVLVTHDMNSVTQFCSRAIVLDHGREIFSGDTFSAVRRFMALQQTIKTPRPPVKEAYSSGVEVEEVEIISSNILVPKTEAFLDISRADIVSDNRVKLLSAAIHDANGNLKRVFEIGEPAWFYFEFLLLDDIETPCAGIVLTNRKGILVHGKNSMQYQAAAPQRCSKGTMIKFSQKVILNLAPDEYSFVVGFATIDADTYLNTNSVSQEILTQATQEILTAGQISYFTVGFATNGIALPHHGLVDLPGECRFSYDND